MGHRSKSFTRSMIFMTFRLRRFHSLPCGFLWFQPQSVFGVVSNAISDCANTFVIPFGALLHGMTGAIGLSTFLFACLPKVFPFFFSHVCLSVSEQCRDSASPMPILVFSPYFWSYMIWSGSRLTFCQSRHGPHWSLGRFFEQQSELRETIPRIRQTSVWIDNPIIIDPFFLQHVQIRMSRPNYVNVFQWNRVCFFHRARRVELEVHCDDDRWSHYGPTRRRHGHQHHLSILSVETPGSPWSSLLKSSLLTVGSHVGEGSRNSKSLPENCAVLQNVFHTEFSHLPGSLGHFADSNSIP